MRTMAILVGVLLAFMALAPLSSYNASAAAASQYLWADDILGTDAEFYVADGLEAFDALNMVNRTATDLGDDFDLEGNYWDDTPGAVFWGDANSAIDGSFGTAEIRYGLTDLIGEVADYYYIDMLVGADGRDGPIGDPFANQCYLNAPGSYEWSMRLGFGYVDADSGTNEFIDEVYHNVSGSGGAAPDKESRTLTWANVENEAEDRPFTASEISNLYVVLQIRFDAGVFGSILGVDEAPPINLAVCFTLLNVVPTTHTPDIVPTGGFVLRPNADKFTNGFDNQTVSDNEGMYGALNETNQHGDADQSYINASWDKAAFVGLEFTDPPAWAQDLDYRVTLWSIIMQTETGAGTYYTLTMSISSDGSDQKAYYPTTSYTNNTHDSDFIPGSADYWRLTDLEDILANLWLNWVGGTPSGEMRVTQIAFLCTPVIPEDYVPDTDDFTDVAFQEWIIGGGLFTMFAIMGAIGLIAGAPLAIIFFKSERTDGAGAVAMAVGIIFVSLCFLLAGLSAWA